MDQQLEETGTQTKGPGSFPVKYFETSLRLLEQFTHSGAFKSENSFMPNYRPPPIRFNSKPRSLVPSFLEILGSAPSQKIQITKSANPQIFPTEIQQQSQPRRVRTQSPSLQINQAVPCIDFCQLVHQNTNLPQIRYAQRATLCSSTLRAYKRTAQSSKIKSRRVKQKFVQIARKGNYDKRNCSSYVLNRLKKINQVYLKEAQKRHSSQLDSEQQEFRQLVSEISQYNKSMLGNLDKLEVENIDDNDEVLNISLSPKVNQKQYIKSTYQPYTRFKNLKDQQAKPITKNVIEKEADNNGNIEIGVQAFVPYN